jgi:hypothetical protein
MRIDYTNQGKVDITMKPYIQHMIDELPEDMAGTSVTPAGNHLFTVIEAEQKLDDETSMMFHHNTAKLLFLC